MKKFTSSILIMFILLICSISAEANLGPVYWYGYPSYNVLAVDENSPIAVEKEDLVFDFSKSNIKGYSINGSGSAAYVMKNTSGDTKAVQMAFPYISSLQNLKSNSPVIKCNGAVIPYEVYLGQNIDVETTSGDNGESQVNFKNIEGSISDKPYSAVSFNDGEKGTLYQIEVNTQSAQEISYEVSFNYNSEKTKVIVNGFNGSRVGNGKVNVSKWCYGQETFEILILGEDIKIDKSGFSSSNPKVNTETCTERITKSEIDLKDYLSEKVQNLPLLYNLNSRFENQRYNLFVRTLDLLLTQNNGFTRISDLESANRTMRVISLLCTVEFQPNSTKEISVNFSMDGTMDRRENITPKYNFEYILNPAKNWSYFKNLSVKVITSEEIPYVLKSNMNFTRENKYLYTANYDTLPEKDLTFTMCSNIILSKVPSSFIISIIIVSLFAFSLFLFFTIYKKRKVKESL